MEGEGCLGSSDSKWENNVPWRELRYDTRVEMVPKQQTSKNAREGMKTCEAQGG